MDFIERLQHLAKKTERVSGSLGTEEATKNALVMPFLHQVLGYDVFDPSEVIPEYTADTGIKKGEKVDYALLVEGEIQILVECKKFGEQLCSKHAGQLFRYFSVTNARLAILTNGSQYKFYTDLDAANKMDEKPFITLDLEDIDEHVVPEIKKLTKSSFNIESIVDAAGELKYLHEIKKQLSAQFASPEEAFVRFFAAKVYGGTLTAKVREQFTELTTKALKQFLSDSINERLKSAFGADVSANETDTGDAIKPEGGQGPDSLKSNSKIVTTDEEIEGFNIVKAIVRQHVDVSRVHDRDAQSYFGVLLDNNNRKPLCRLHFNGKKKYIGLFDADKRETKHHIESLDQIFNFADELIGTLLNYGVNAQQA